MKRKLILVIEQFLQSLNVTQLQAVYDALVQTFKEESL